MHRTQIMLEDSQYNWLQEESRARSKSMGQLVRELVDVGLEKVTTKAHCYRLADTSGMFQQDKTRGRDHNRHLYCTSFAIMDRLGIATAVAVDEDFRRAGYHVLPDL